MYRIILLLLFFGLFNSVNATLIERDLFSSGDGLLTFDSETGIEWLDITETVGTSYSDVLSSNFVTDLGFGYAYLDQLNTIYDHAGGTGNYLIPRSVLNPDNYNGVPIEEHYNPARFLLDLMGCTSYVVNQDCDGLDQDWHIGFYGDEVVGGLQYASAVGVYLDYPLDLGMRDTGYMWTDHYESSPDRTRNDFGSYLVRTTSVPEPSTLTILGLGLFGLYRQNKSLKN